MTRPSLINSHLVRIVRRALPALQRALRIPDIRTFSRSVLQRDVRILSNKEALTGCAVGAAGCKAEGCSVAAKAGTELDTEVRAGNLDRGRAFVVDE